MCGIAGLAANFLERSERQALISSMRMAISHRGPDSGKDFSDENISLGMQRLAIIDLPGGEQPMFIEDDSIAIVYNGEIYNAASIRKELIKQGIPFYTRSDTEVILRLYQQNTEKVEQHLHGMWAFCIYDKPKRRIILSRDRFGIKPLFIAQVEQGLAFSSELDSLLQLCHLPHFFPLFSLNKSAAHAMLSWSYIPEDATIFSGIRRLPPATRYTVNLDGWTAYQSVYWELQPSHDSAYVRTLSEACELIEPLLQKSIQGHLTSDVPFATMLSGGIDSSLVNAYITDSGIHPTAYSTGSLISHFDETEHAKQTAKLLDLPHQIVIIDDESICKTLAEALLAHDEPFGDSSSIAAWILCKKISENYKVALGGDGGDEIFAGYAKHRIIPVRDALATFPYVRKVLKKVLNAFPRRIDRTSRWSELLRKTHRIARGLEEDDALTYVYLTQIASLEVTAPLLRDTSSASFFEAKALERFHQAKGEQLYRTLFCDLSNMLPNDMLTKMDRASMACSLEVRVPFLDHSLVEAGLGLPASFTLGKRGKEVLRALHAKWFGTELASRPKQGWGVPVEQWLRTWLAPCCDELFTEKRIERLGLLSTKTLGGGRWRTWVQHNPQILWNAVVLSLWGEAKLGKGPDEVRSLLRVEDSKPFRVWKKQ
ncbi:asparagine synthase (glutamine-hydrolyzing) [Pajaroellobacter abortibovis]|uniref:asparagine synthase (glutamine-hydrolyzing) n=1 Tax=Pajaroellobacter abortibovis TaxID=1882918 RepID=A0A1L6MVM9_9BACT|nr:asparagine synthase (glutamine-hydrolyzing) [Pajaroellobacter abortibovis]APR99603.1 asparagine synthase (glutamine-hydrolyzing) [Pajaroellobacter abortibovis]